MTKIPSVEKEIEYLRFAMRGGCNCKGCEDDRANIGGHCVIRQALQAQRDAGYRQCLLEIKHEQRKLLDGFGHPKDCDICLTPPTK